MEVWYDMMLEADLVVLSKSTFSFIPGVFTNADTVVCWPFEGPCHPRWKETTGPMKRQEMERFGKMIDTRCDKEKLIDGREWLKLNKTYFFERFGDEDHSAV
jgi:hypothetical protein